MTMKRRREPIAELRACLHAFTALSKDLGERFTNITDFVNALDATLHRINVTPTIGAKLLLTQKDKQFRFPNPLHYQLFLLQ
jgi:hypothetical protein